MPQAIPEDDPQPVPPVPPELDDCCHSGCSPCVFDLYDEALERYKAELAEWKTRQAHEAQRPLLPSTPDFALSLKPPSASPS